MKKNYTGFFILICCTLTLMTAAPAQAGLLEFLFPTLRDTGPDPSETLQAPFAHETAKPQAGTPALPLAENMVPLDQPHENTAQLSQWLMVSASELMTLDTTDLANNFSRHDRYFTPTGKQQYVDYLTQNNFIKNLQSGRYQITSVVSGQPVLLNEGVVEGRYHWLYEVPVMASYIEQGATSYKKIQPVTQNFSLILQIGRMDKANEKQSVLIERWSAKK